ncbi:hypothetical protein [Streptomyces collinus]
MEINADVVSNDEGIDVTITSEGALEDGWTSDPGILNHNEIVIC